MYDMNFFSVYKRSKSKNGPFILFLLILLVLVVLLNGLLIGGRIFIFGGIRDEIQSMRDYINNPATKEAMEEASRIKSEADLTNQYLSLLQSVDGKLDRMDLIDSSLLKEISLLTPEDIMFRSAQLNGSTTVLICESVTPTSPMDMYHAFNESPLFADVVMSGISITDTGSAFSLSFIVRGEEGVQP